MKINIITRVKAASAAVFFLIAITAPVLPAPAETASSHRARAAAFYDDREYLKAAESYAKALSLESSISHRDRAVYYRNIGSCYKSAGQPDKAIEAYTKAISLDPKDYMYYTVRAGLYADKGEKASAIRDYTKSIELDTSRGVKDGFPYKRRGDLYMKAGDYAEAVRDFESALKFRPDQKAYKEALDAAKKKRGYAKFSLMSPRVVSERNYDLRVCVVSDFDVDNDFVKLNGSEVKLTRGFDVVDDDDCARVVKKRVELREGENEIRVDVLSNGVKNGELFIVTYNAPVEPVDPVNQNERPRSADPVPVAGGRRAALVIGNDNYERSPLQGSVNDAKNVAAKLKTLGFDVTPVIDADYEAMKRKVIEFEAKARGDSVVLIYFAGHGIQYENKDWFLPIDADLRKIVELNAVKYQALSTGDFVRAMDGTDAKVKILMLDACRDSPKTARNSGGDGISGGVQKSKSVGLFIAYAAASGEKALDNSAFTKGFLDKAGLPGENIIMLFTNIAKYVSIATDGFQKVWKEENLVDPFYFAGENRK